MNVKAQIKFDRDRHTYHLQATGWERVGSTTTYRRNDETIRIERLPGKVCSVFGYYYELIVGAFRWRIQITSTLPMVADVFLGTQEYLDKREVDLLTQLGVDLKVKKAPLAPTKLQ